MSDSGYRAIIRDGLWNNNYALVALLGLCPLLAVSNTAINGLGLGLATMMVLICSNGAISLIRHLIRPEIRVPVFVMVIAAFTTAIDLTMHAYFHELHKILGIFIPLIVTNCMMLGRAEAFAAKNNVRRSLLDGLFTGLGFATALTVLGMLRELVGQGTLFSQAHLMFGEGARALTLTVFHDYPGFLVAILPPGAFIGLAMLIALKNIIDSRLKQRSELARKPAGQEVPGATGA